MSDVRIFRVREFTETGGNADFERDTPLDNKPNAASHVAYTTGGVGPESLFRGIIKEIAVHLTSTNAVTYQLAIYQCIDGANNSYELESDRLFYSPNQPGGSPDPLANDTHYVWKCLCTPFVLDDVAFFYFNINWSAAPGRVNGFIEIEGRREAYGEG